MVPFLLQEGDKLQLRPPQKAYLWFESVVVKIRTVLFRSTPVLILADVYPGAVSTFYCQHCDALFVLLQSNGIKFKLLAT